MQQTQHTSAQVLLHPACTTNPAAVRAVQQATGRLIVLCGGKPKLLKSEPLPGTLGHLPLFINGDEDFPSLAEPRRARFIDEVDTGPFGGDAA